jgi:hypothetical protein
MSEMSETLPVYVEGWDPSYGAPAELDAADADTAASTLVEDGDRLEVHDGRPSPPDVTISFVDGVRRVEGFLSFVDPSSGELLRGLAGAFGVGAVSFAPGRTGGYAHVTTRRLAVVCGGRRVDIPDVPGGWHWDVVSTAETEIEHAAAVLHEQMRQGEARLARHLGESGALTVVDGNLTYVRSIDGRFIGCVKTHRHHYLVPEHRTRVATLAAGQRTSLFTVRNDCYAAYLRLVARGPHHPPWHGVVRIELPQSLGLDAAVELADLAAGTLPGFAGIEGHDPRAPQNLQPIGALERRLRHLLGPADLALRALRTAVARTHPVPVPVPAT